MFLIFELVGIALVVVGQLLNDFILMSAGGLIGVAATTLILIAYGKIIGAKTVDDKIAILATLGEEYDRMGATNSAISLYREIADLRKKKILAQEWKWWLMFSD